MVFLDEVEAQLNRLRIWRVLPRQLLQQIDDVLTAQFSELWNRVDQFIVPFLKLSTEIWYLLPCDNDDQFRLTLPA